MALWKSHSANQAMLNQLAQNPIEKSQSDQPIVGLRVWKVIDDAGLPKLRSVFKETVWPYRKALQRDVLNDMGIHAVKPGIRSGPSIADPAALCTGMDVLSLFAQYDADVAGEVYLWGKVEEHTEGYLADFAYPKKLYPHADLDPVVAMQLEDEYGVPVEYRPEFTKQKPVKQEFYPGAILGVSTASAGSQMLYPQPLSQQQIAYYQQLQNAQANALSNQMIYVSRLMGLGWKP